MCTRLQGVQIQDTVNASQVTFQKLTATTVPKTIILIFCNPCLPLQPHLLPSTALQFKQQSPQTALPPHTSHALFHLHAFSHVIPATLAVYSLPISFTTPSQLLHILQCSTQVLPAPGSLCRAVRICLSFVLPLRLVFLCISMPSLDCFITVFLYMCLPH